MGLLYLIRHGQASFGSKNYDHLSDIGQCQARILARHFKTVDLVFDAVYCGTMERHKETVKPLCRMALKNLYNCPEPICTNGFDEVDAKRVWHYYYPALSNEASYMDVAVDPLQLDRKVFQQLFEKIMNAWISDLDPQGLQTWKSFAERVWDGLMDVIKEQGPGKTIAVFTSAGPIAAILQQTMNLTNDVTLGLLLQVMNASITRVQYNDRKLTLHGFNGVGHLALKKAPALMTYR